MNESMIERVARATCLGDPDSMVGRIKSEKSANGMMRVWSDDNDLIPAWQQGTNLTNAKRAIETIKDALPHGIARSILDKALEDG